MIFIWLAMLGLAVLASYASPAAAAILPWIVAGSCMSAVAITRARAVIQPRMGELDNFLERCRRRGEPATVLCVEMPADAKAVQSLLRSARITDSLVVRRAGTRCEVYGLLDGGDVPRAMVESRMSGALKGVTPTFGWAAYPADGLTLEVLLEKARESVHKSTQSDGPHRNASWAMRNVELSTELTTERA